MVSIAVMMPCSSNDGVTSPPVASACVGFVLIGLVLIFILLFKVEACVVCLSGNGPDARDKGTRAAKTQRDIPQPFFNTLRRRPVRARSVFGSETVPEGTVSLQAIVIYCVDQHC